MRPARGLWLMVWLAAGGCASHSDHASTKLFVKPGKPSMEIGKPVQVAKGSNQAPRHRTVEKLRPATNFLPTLESTDRPLSAALLTLAIAATPEAHRAVAERYRALGVLDMAYDHYLSASQLDRTDAAAYEGLARIWRDWGFPQLGLADASRAAFYAPGSPSAHNTRGTLLGALGQNDDARREYERAVELDPQAAYALNNLCSLSFVAGDTVKAAAECRQALAADPALTAARDTLASIERRNARARVP